MSPLTHFMGSWLVAAVTTDNPRDRRLVTLAGILPDADGLGLLVDVTRSLTSGQWMTISYYQKFHHLWLHGWPAALGIAAILTCFARLHWRVAFWCLVTVHLHLLCDLLGSRGPSPADLWPICYGEPLFRGPVWFWRGQWRLDGWQNQLITALVLAVCLLFAARNGHSFVGVFSRRLDAVFVAVLQKWRTSIFRRSPG